MAPASDALRRGFDEAPMSRVQIGAVALTVLLSALDGYDVLSITFAAPAITRDWHVGRVVALLAALVLATNKFSQGRLA